METARLSKRVWAYIFNLILYVGTGFGVCAPLYIIFALHPLIYVLISLGEAIIASFIFDCLLMAGTKGRTIGSAIMGVKYVASDGERLSGKQIIVRSSSESTLIFVLFDLIYFLNNKTERGVIDRLSDSFAIDTRI